MPRYLSEFIARSHRQPIEQMASSSHPPHHHAGAYKAEYMLLVWVYVLFIALLSLALWFRNTVVSTAIVAFVLVIVVIEATYVLYYKFGSSMCDICHETVCGQIQNSQ